MWSIWFITWLGLLAGLYDNAYNEFVVILSAVHAILFAGLFKMRLMDFPVQLRIVYFAWVLLGTYHLRVLMYITTVGLAANLFVGYCPLARMMYLLPWNRSEPFSAELVVRVFLSPPVNGRFTTAPGTKNG